MAKMPEKKNGLLIEVKKDDDGESTNNICMKTSNPLFNEIIAPKLEQFGEVVDLDDVIEGMSHGNPIMRSLIGKIVSGSEYHIHLIVNEFDWDPEEVAQYLRDVWEEEVQKLSDVERHLDGLDLDDLEED